MMILRNGDLKKWCSQKMMIPKGEWGEGGGQRCAPREVCPSPARSCSSLVSPLYVRSFLPWLIHSKQTHPHPRKNRDSKQRASIFSWLNLMVNQRAFLLEPTFQIYHFDLSATRKPTNHSLLLAPCFSLNKRPNESINQSINQSIN